LLLQRSSLTTSFFNLTTAAILVTFCLSALLFWINDRMLATQLRQRQAAEHKAQLLSTALMRIQDEERRKFSRELHDSLGQTLAGVKMFADTISARAPNDPALAQLSELLHDALKETRTLSQLLHPPLLDEVGFMSAARWFVDEFSQRTSVAVQFDAPTNFPELPKNIELTLFRILQEALTNVHRHAKSPTAKVELSAHAKKATLRIQDYGVGIPDDKLSRFQSDGSGVGVGLAGMRNRVREQGGSLIVNSSDSGTTIVAELPTDYALNAPSAPSKRMEQSALGGT
jgi:two-component system, NarL family, sensor kinase